MTRVGPEPTTRRLRDVLSPLVYNRNRLRRPHDGLPLFPCRHDQPQPGAMGRRPFSGLPPRRLPD